jgi:hypothetical protein
MNLKASEILDERLLKDVKRKIDLFLIFIMMIRNRVRQISEINYHMHKEKDFSSVKK